MAELKSWKTGIGFLVCLCVVGVFYFGYFYCSGPSCALRGKPRPMFQSNYEAYLAGKYLHNKFQENDLQKDYNIDLDNQDVIVFLHIQKTGGTVFGKHLVENLVVDPPCYCYKRVKKHCDCMNKRKEVWLFSRYSTGWRCGLHADWTELTNCVKAWFEQTYGKRERTYHYITMLRDPVRRFLSEWIHVSERGATWKGASLKCNGRDATLEEVPFCYSNEDWTGVTLQQFMDCPHNLAFNRQTRMLADLTRVHCYNTSVLTPERRDALMLASAKDNLRRHVAYFGLLEFQTFSQQLFEHTLHMKFLRDFEQHNVTHSSRLDLTEDLRAQVLERNRLDVELYQFAKDLFLQRVLKMLEDQGSPVPPHLLDLIRHQAAPGPDPEDDLQDVDGEGDGGGLFPRQSPLLSSVDGLGPPPPPQQLQLQAGGSLPSQGKQQQQQSTFSRKKMFGKKTPGNSSKRKKSFSRNFDSLKTGKTREEMFGKKQSASLSGMMEGGDGGGVRGSDRLSIGGNGAFSASDVSGSRRGGSQQQKDTLENLIRDKMLQSKFLRR